jgi:hypothetical protein
MPGKPSCRRLVILVVENICDHNEATAPGCLPLGIVLPSLRPLIRGYGT